MDLGIHSPFLDFFRRGEVAREIRLLAARGALAPRAHEQVSLLALLTEDADPEVRAICEETLAQIPRERVAAFLGRSDVSEGLRQFFKGRGIEPNLQDPALTDDPLIDTAPEPEASVAEPGQAVE